MSKILSGEKYLELPASPETWLVDPLLPSGGALLLYGDPKVGKSYAALQLAGAIASGSDWLGFPVRKGKVVYLQLDTPRNIWQTRLKDLLLKGELAEMPLFADRESLDAWPFDILNPEHLSMLKEELSSISPDLVIFDTLRESHSAKENDSTEMQNVVASLVAATQPAAICLISHSRKPSQDENPSLMNDNRGSTYVVGRMDGVARFTPKSAWVSGRSIEEHSLDLERLDSGFWAVQSGEQNMHCLSCLLDSSHATLRDAARTLAVKIGKSESQSRGILRRYLSSHPDVKTHLRG